MRTDDLVRVLGRSGAAVDSRAARTRFWAPVAATLLVSVAIVLATVGVRPDWRAAAALPMFWFKMALPASVGVAAAVCLHRLGHPGARWRDAALAIAVPLAIAWLAAGYMLGSAPEAQRGALVLGRSWLQCVIAIPVLSIPAFALAFRAARSLVPTRLALTGAVAGLAAGAAAAFAYALYCDEMQAPFLATWYVMGMAVPAFAGAVAGPRLLRW